MAEGQLPAAGVVVGVVGSSRAAKAGVRFGGALCVRATLGRGEAWLRAWRLALGGAVASGPMQWLFPAPVAMSASEEFEMPHTMTALRVAGRFGGVSPP